ncbi:MAG: dTDP-glucose 4,6-dehydratase [Proteobacteria bacterium]|nr:MAG: dTDP-glucose 4,6-dehydratase [Pseudomonadota bacterium]PIE66874.1 MAG: dTDP-glucose 4,6-dehydratase [Deltaproteobacteria bacterium]
MKSDSTLIVTGGAGFIGANFIHHWLAEYDGTVINLDKLTYAGNPRNLDTLAGDDRYVFVKGDIGDTQLVASLLERCRPRAIVNFAAESHVDRSITAPDDFIQTNVVGTFNLLQQVRHYRDGLDAANRNAFRFLHVSTDEVYGSLGLNDPAFTETSAYAPNSPYSASKAASDHLVRASHHTYGLPTLTTNCSNNYGPCQFPEKLIPLVIHRALKKEPIPVYGDGSNIRDWLFVTDHCRAIATVLNKGRPGEVYNIGGDSELTNIDLVRTLCATLDELAGRDDGRPYADQITFVTDRPGHDRRYAINATKIKSEMGWAPVETFETGIRKTVRWYLDNREWVAGVTSGAYQQWIDTNYGER